MPVKIEFVIEEYPRELIRQPFFGHMIDGELKIWLNNQLYFQQPVALVEFAACVKQWLIEANQAGQATPLVYYTLDHDEREGPVLRLTPVSADSYLVESIWQEYEHKPPIKHLDMMVAVAAYLQKLDAVIRRFGDTDLQTLLAQQP